MKSKHATVAAEASKYLWISICLIAVGALALVAVPAFGQGDWPDPETRNGDTARFQDQHRQGSDPLVVLVPAQTSDTEICSRPSPGGNCYRFTNTENTSQAMVILLHSEDMWRNTGPDQFNSAKRSDYAAVCEASETWTSWSAVGDIPATPGSTYTEQRSCSPGPASDNVPVCDCAEQTQTRTATVVGEQCEYSAWRPLRSTVDKGVTFTQTRSLTSGPASCPGPYSRERTGTRESWDCGYGSWAPARSTWLVTENKEQRRTASLDDPVNCPELTRIIQGTDATPWTPEPGSVCSGETFEQSRWVYSAGSPGNKAKRTRDATGTKNCVCRYGDWYPSASNYTVGTQFDQFRDPLPGEPAHCATDGREAWGTNPTSWTPGTNTYCEGVTFTQSRYVYSSSAADRRELDEREATGTKECNCDSWTPWAPSPSEYSVGTKFTQYSDPAEGQPAHCTTRSQDAWGTIPTAWLPLPSTVCDGETFKQRRWVYSSSAPNHMEQEERDATGTKVCIPPQTPCDYNNDWTPVSWSKPVGPVGLSNAN